MVGNVKGTRKLNIVGAVLPIIVVIALGLASVMKWHVGMFMPLVGSIVFTVLIGIFHGFKWSDLQKGMIDGVSRALPAIFIMIVVGMIIGTWIQSGIIPTMIYFSLKMISPRIFVPAAFIVTAIVATATGTSFTSLATIGLALMATGVGFGFPAPLLAGAIISGAFVGDAMSPLSDNTNLASALTGATLFEEIGSVAWAVIPAILISTVMFYFQGVPFSKNVSLDSEVITELLKGIDKMFVISPLLLVVPFLTVILTIKKVPAVPTLIIVTVIAALCGVFVQGAEWGQVLASMTGGFVSETGNKMVDSLLTSGGITSVAGTVVLIILSTSLGGVMETVGALSTISETIMKPVKSTGGLVLVTAISGFAVAFATGAQLLAVVLPSRMYADEFKKRNLHPKNLARITMAVGTVGITLVPWSVPSSYAQAVLGVESVLSLRFMFFPIVLAVIVLFFGFTGFTMTKLNPEKDQEKDLEKLSKKVETSLDSNFTMAKMD